MSNLEKSVLDVMQELVENENIENEKKAIHKSIKPLIEARLDDNKSKNLWKKTNFEEWLSFLVNIIYLGSNDKSPVDKLKLKVDQDIDIQHLKEFVKFMSKAIYAECALTFDMNDTPPPHISFLSKLVARESILGRTHLFTLNYDTIFEQALEEIGIQYADGFSGKANAHFDPSVYGLDVHYAGDASEGRIRRFDKFLYFYKLHGSIHWRIDNNKLKSRHDDLLKYTEYQKLSKKKENETELEKQDRLNKLAIEIKKPRLSFKLCKSIFSICPRNVRRVAKWSVPNFAGALSIFW
jgi:hypothetical protein